MRILCCALLGAGLLPSSSAAAASKAPVPRIVNGLTSSGYPAVGVLLWAAGFPATSLTCTGTLVGCQTFVTAGHCVDGSVDPDDYRVFLPHVGILAVSDVTIHPTYRFPTGDIAVLKLASPVSGVRPIPINETQDPPLGFPGTIVGYGRVGGSNSDGTGIKRVGTVITASCVGHSSATTVCWNFSDPIGPPGTDSNTCSGDSGGPLFMNFGAGDVLAGVTSGGNSEDCLPDDHSFDVNVYYYRNWIASLAGSDLASTACGCISQVGDAQTGTFNATGTLDEANQSDIYSFSVDASTKILRVTMNSESGTDFDLYVRRGSPPTPTTSDCASNAPSAFEACEFNDPVADTWYAAVFRYGGEGQYQLTATIFEQALDGQPCDDGNSCTLPDTCQAGVCSGVVQPDSTPCNDGSYCTRGDVCSGGLCAGNDLLAASCRRVTRSNGSLLFLKNNADDLRDRLLWKWGTGELTTKAEFGSVANMPAYALCVFDESGGGPALVAEKIVHPGGWKELRSGFKYEDRTKSSDGISTIVLKAGSDGTARIVVNGRGPDLQVNTLPPLQHNPRVSTYLTNGSICWQADYDAFILNDSTTYKARGD